ncbi:MAG: hypothetical protein JWO41_769 [Candidatus Saccharibacteria bacterium]|nr:hypothetical protein [Candidatus Saccharibacteria bacterium]
MSAEITTGTDSDIAADAAHLAAEILVETGSTTSEAFTYGVKAARYGAEVLLVALREMEAVSGDLDQEAFKDALQKVDAQVLPLGHLVGAARLGEEMLRHSPSELVDLQESNEPLADLLNRLADNPTSGITEQLRAAIIAGRAETPSE